MRFWRLAFPAVLIVLATTGAARAQEGFYVGLQGGYNDLFGVGINEECFLGLACDAEATANFDGGFAAGAVAGFRMADGVAFEFEATRRGNSFLSIDWSDAERATDGDVRSHAFMANVMVDLHPGPAGPYVGFGIGAASVEFRNISDANGPLFNGTRMVIAGQAMAGIGVEVTPGTRISADYRLFVTSDALLRFDSGQRAEIAGRSADVQYMQQTLMIGVRQSF